MLTRRTLILGAAALTVPLPARARDAADRARGTVRALLENAHKALLAGEESALHRAIGDAFDFATWERFLLGKRAEIFTPNQVLAFRALLPGYLARLYRDRFDNGLDQPPGVGAARKARRDMLVSSVFPRANGRDLPVDWRVRETGDLGPRIIDIMIGGTSFLLLKRDEFAAIIDKGGANALLDHMRGQGG